MLIESSINPSHPTHLIVKACIMVILEFYILNCQDTLTLYKLFDVLNYKIV